MWQQDPSNIEGMRMKVQVMLCFENKMSEAASVLADMLKSIEQLETRNANLCLQGNPGRKTIIYGNRCALDSSNDIFSLPSKVALFFSFYVIKCALLSSS